MNHLQLVPGVDRSRLRLVAEPPREGPRLQLVEDLTEAERNSYRSGRWLGMGRRDFVPRAQR